MAGDTPELLRAIPCRWLVSDLPPDLPPERLPLLDHAGPDTYSHPCDLRTLAATWGDPEGSYAHRGERVPGDPLDWFRLDEAEEPARRLRELRLAV